MNPEYNNFPQWAKLIMTMIDRIGFPILAFGVMAYMCFVTLAKVTNSIDSNSILMRDAIGKNTEVLNALKREIVGRER